MRVDLNADVGEGAPNDDELLALVTSANIACGVHAGDPELMARTVRRAAALGVSLGAHPSLADRAGFGRREQPLSPEAAEELVRGQTSALQESAARQGARVRHVKPHGALYNMAARDPALAQAVAAAVRALDPELVLFGLAGSALVQAGRAAGLRVAEEFFVDRGYGPDGALLPRGRPGAIIADAQEAVARAVRAVREGRVRAADGTDLPVRAETLCLHGDQPEALAFARKLREALLAAGVILQPAGAP